MYIIGTIAFVGVFLAQYFALIFATSKTDNTGKFDLKPDRILQDISGRGVPVSSNQVWPFDPSQNISIKVIGKKQVDELVAVAVDVEAIAPVNKDAMPKEMQGQKFPNKLKLSGRAKLTYEFIDKEWYLISIDNLSLRTVGLD
jgi:hypothetical protein